TKTARLGADGARSITRRSIGLRLEGTTYPSVTWQATSRFSFEAAIENIAVTNYFWTRTDSGSLIHLPEGWRVTFYPRETDAPDQVISDEAFHERRSEVCNSSSFELTDRTAYRIHQRIVPRYCIGRVALAGDAAHLNAPTGGMGLNG